MHHNIKMQIISPRATVEFWLIISKVSAKIFFWLRVVKPAVGARLIGLYFQLPPLNIL